MSLILDALRKMEQERKTRRGASVNLRPEVLRYRAEVKPQKGRPYLLVTLGLALVVVGGGAGFLLKGHHRADGSPTVEDGRVAVKAQTAPQATVMVDPVAPAPPVASAPAAAPLAPAAGSPAAPSVASQPAVVSPPAPMAAPPSVAAAAGRSARPARRGAASATQPAYAHAEPSSQAPEGSIPDITVSGIAWQEERSLRRAVLNGTLVGEGADVAGARVVEIRENRVRLSRGGQIFDVLYSSGLSSR